MNEIITTIYEIISKEMRYLHCTELLNFFTSFARATPFYLTANILLSFYEIPLSIE
jgi:hypothetical protein